MSFNNYLELLADRNKLLPALRVSMRAYDDSNDDSGSAYTPDHHPVEPPHAEPAPIHANELPDAHLNAAPEVDPHHTEAPIENNEVHYYPEVHAAPEPVHEQPAPEPHTDPVQHVDLAPIDNGITHAEVYTPAFSLAPTRARRGRYRRA